MIGGVQAWIAKNTAKLAVYGAVAVLWIGSVFGAYFYGKAAQRTEYAKAEATVLKSELEVAEKEGQLNAAVAERVGAETARMDARLRAAIGELNEAIAKANRGTACDLTPDELRALQALSDSYE